MYVCGVAYLSYVGDVMNYWVCNLGVVIVHECGENGSDNDDFSYGVVVVVLFVGVASYFFKGGMLCGRCLVCVEYMEGIYCRYECYPS